MDQQLIIKLTGTDENSKPIGLVESPPMLYVNFKELNKEITFSNVMIDSELLPFGYGPFDYNSEAPIIEYFKTAEYVGLTKHSDNIWRKTWEIRDATQDEINQRTDEKAMDIRSRRNKALRITDFTHATDSTKLISEEKRKEFTEYRQKLRDLPLQDGFPFNVIIPEMPNLIES